MAHGASSSTTAGLWKRLNNRCASKTWEGSVVSLFLMSPAAKWFAKNALMGDYIMLGGYTMRKFFVRFLKVFFVFLLLVFIVVGGLIGYTIYTAEKNYNNASYVTDAYAPQQNNLASLTDSQAAWVGVYESTDYEGDFVFVMIGDNDFELEIVGYDSYNDTCYPMTRGNSIFEDDNTILDSFDCALPWDYNSTYDCSASIVKEGDYLTYTRDAYLLVGNVSESNDANAFSADDFELIEWEITFVKNPDLDVDAIWLDYQDKDFDFN